MNDHPECAFCAIITGEAPAELVYDGPLTVTFVPLNPVTPGHVLVAPRLHVPDFTADPDVTSYVALVAARHAQEYREQTGGDVNLITSAGPNATQTVDHLHVHVVPRRKGDGLLLPWSRPRIAVSESLDCDGGGVNAYAPGGGSRLTITEVDRRRSGRWTHTTYELGPPPAAPRSSELAPGAVIRHTGTGARFVITRRKDEGETMTYRPGWWLNGDGAGIGDDVLDDPDGPWEIVSTGPADIRHPDDGTRLADQEVRDDG